MAVMAEFLMRGYNVAIPEVDVGDDILVGYHLYQSHANSFMTTIGYTM